MKIKTKLFILFLFLSVVPSLIIGNYLESKIEKNTSEKILDAFQINMELLVTALNDRIWGIERILNTATETDAMLKLFVAEPDLDKTEQAFKERNIANFFNTIAFNSPHVKSIAVISNTRPTQVYGDAVSNDRGKAYVDYFTDDRFQFQEWYQEMQQKTNKLVWTTIMVEGEPYIIAAKNFTYYLLGEPMGTIVFLLHEDTFEEYLMNKSVGVTCKITEHEKMPGVVKHDSFRISQSEDEFFFEASLSNSWIYSTSISKDYLLADVYKIKQFTNLLILSSAVLSIFAAFLISHSIGSKTEKLVRKFDRLQKGDFTIEKNLTSSDEFSYIENCYNNTLQQLSQVINQNYIYKLEKREAELVAMQYQINPHFLYNTLEVINAMASVYGGQDIQEVVQRLGEMYRYNTENPKNVKTYLADELMHIKNYIYLHNIQRSNSLEVYFSVGDDTLDCEVIKFILQPIVENAVKHGIKEKGGMGCIEIAAEIQPDQQVLCIDVSDDGVGISPEQETEINRELRMDSSMARHVIGIGLKNVNDRIMLKYGDEYGVTVSSRYGAGTCISIRIPVRRNDKIGGA